MNVSSARDPGVPIPLAIRGQSTVVRITFPDRDEKIEPGQFQRDEICYLEAGDFRIDCYTDGSSLNLGPSDSSDLLTDNPMYGLAPAKADEKDAATAMKLVYYAYGSQDPVVRSPGQLKNTLTNYGIKLTLHETGGGHTWINWREYLNDFAPRLFK